MTSIDLVRVDGRSDGVVVVGTNFVSVEMTPDQAREMAAALVREAERAELSESSS
jgi:ketopantoate hydroxymethyltransferase